VHPSLQFEYHCVLFVSQAYSYVIGFSRVSTSGSQDGLETYQRLVLVSSWQKLSTSWSRPFMSCA